MISQFKKTLKNVALLGCFLKLTRIPAGILMAGLLSDIVSDANKGKVEDVLMQSLILLLIGICMQLIEVTGGMLFQIKKEKAVHRCRLYLYEQMAASSLESLFLLGFGNAKEKFNDDFDTVTGRIAGLYPDFLAGIITFASYMVFLYFQSWQIALALFIMALLQIVPPVIVKKFLQVNYENCREIEAQLTDFVVGGYEGFLTIKLYGLKKWWLGELKQLHRRYLKIGASSIYTGAAESTLDELVSMVLSYGVYGVVGLLALAGCVPLEEGVQAIALSGSLFSASKTIFSMIAKFGVAKTAEYRLCKGFCAEGDMGDDGRMCGAVIRVTDVSWSYDSKELFRRVNVFIGEGQTVVIKGENGTGKSTLLHLMTGLIHCREGRVEMGGVEACRLSEGSFPQDIFYLPQEDAEFNFSASELYRMCIPEKAERAEHLAEKFGLTEEIMKSREIAALSGGERKKVYLALAFAVNPLVMLLDEPTNSLDKAGRIQLKGLIRERVNSTIIVSHDGCFDDISDHVYMFAEGGIELHG